MRADFFYRSIGGPLAAGVVPTKSIVHVYARR